MIGTTVGRYRIDTLLGEGGMGRVYRAFDTTLGRPAAVKVLGANLTGERLQRFMREARTASSLNHPNVVTIYEVGPLGDDAGHFIAMELVEGETLRHALRDGRIELSRTLEWVAQIADGIATAHKAGITHRDLKPENIVIARTGFAKILDFGLAKLHEEPVDPSGDTPTAVMSTTPGMVLGTVGYMSPEQASGREVDHRSDLFSIGCILYECITGRRPFVGDSNIDTLHKIIYGEPPPIEERAPDTPRELQRIVRKLLAKDAEQRYQSAKDLALDLRDLKSELGSHSQPRVIAIERRKPPVWLAIAAAVVMAVLAFVIYRTKRDPVPPPEPPSAAAKPISMTRVTTTGNVIASAISPNGEYIAYAYSEGGRHSIWLRQLASASAIEIVPAAHIGVWGLRFAPDSRSIYYGLKSADELTGTLYQLPILGGTPRKLLTDIESAVTFSPDGKQMAFFRIHAPNPGDSSLVIANADGTGQRTLLTKSPPEFLAPSFFGEPAWSPDGKTIAGPLRIDRSSKLIGVDTTTGATRELSKDTWQQVLNPAWLPDGLAVAARTDQRSPAQLWLIAPDGTRRRLSNDLYEYRTLTATADGKSLLAVAAETRTAVWRTTPEENAPATRVTNGRSDGNAGVAVADDGTIFYTAFERGAWDIYRAEPGAAPRLLTTGDAGTSGPSLSPDGKYIVFGLSRDESLVLARMNSRDGSDVRVLCPLVPTGGGPQRAAFTPDSRWVIFNAGLTGTSQLWKVSIDGGQPVRVADVDARFPAVSPDGKLIAFSGAMIGVVPMDGGAPRKVENTNPTNSSMVSWMPDGKSLLHSAGLTDRANLWLQPLDGSTPRQLTRFDTDMIVRFELSPNGKHLVIVRGLLERDAMLITR